MRLRYTLYIFIFLATTSIAQYSFHESIGLFPTAFNLKQGESRYTITNIHFNDIFNGLAHGINDNLSINTGAALLEDTGLNAMIRLKYTHRVADNVRLGIAPQINFTNDPYAYDRSLINPQLAGVLTIGKPARYINFSYSTGIDIVKYKEIEKSNNYLSIGGSIKISRSCNIFTEHFLEFEGSDLGNLYNAHSLMARISFKERHQIKFGAIQFATYYTNRDGNKEYEPDYLPLLVFAYSYHWGL